MKGKELRAGGGENTSLKTTCSRLVVHGCSRCTINPAESQKIEGHIATRIVRFRLEQNPFRIRFRHKTRAQFKGFLLYKTANA